MGNISNVSTFGEMSIHNAPPRALACAVPIARCSGGYIVKCFRYTALWLVLGKVGSGVWGINVCCILKCFKYIVWFEFIKCWTIACILWKKAGKWHDDIYIKPYFKVLVAG